jgi:hypothetical protein
LASSGIDGAAQVADEQEQSGGAAVRRRRVFYIAGFDPRGAGYYHRLYREEARKQAALTGATIEVGPRRNQGRMVARWSVRADYQGRAVDTDYWFLRWDDLVRARWKTSEPRQLGEAWRNASAFMKSGVAGLMLRRGWPTFVAGAVPVTVTSLYILALAAAAIGVGVLGARIAEAVHAPAWLGAVPALAVLTQIATLWRWIDNRLSVSWLNRCFTYMVETAADPGQADARCDAFAQLVADAAGEAELDEVLLVGHSQGTLHAIRTAARVLAMDPLFGARGARFSLLTLGQPFAAYTPLPDDEGFRQDLSRVAASPALVWLDETAPSDPVSSCGVDPLCGLAADGRLWPIRKSPRFHLLLSKRRFRQIKLKPLDFHFQYIMAGEKLGEYDFYRLTAGPDVMPGARAR